MHCRRGGAGCGWRVWGAPPRNEGSSSVVLEPLVPGSVHGLSWGVLLCIWEGRGWPEEWTLGQEPGTGAGWGGWVVAALVPSALPEPLPLILTTTQQGCSHHSILQTWKPRLRDVKCWLQVVEQGLESRAPNKH